MLIGAFALLERSLRIDARGWLPHLARFGLVSTIYVSLCLAIFTQSVFGAPGMRFYQGIAYLDAVFMTLLGLSFFSTSITEEKEEDTLGLMLMAGISPAGILMGKSAARLWQALLLVAVQYPFGFLAVTMGGLTTAQIAAVTISLLAYLLFLAGFGLFCSTMAPRNRTAGGMMSIGISLYFGLPYIVTAIDWMRSNGWFGDAAAAVQFPILWSLLEAAGELSIRDRISAILQTGFNESPFSKQAVINGLAGLLFAGLSWLSFGVATRGPSPERSTRGTVARDRHFLRFPAGRPWNNPFVWKDFHFVSGGMGMVGMRTLFFILIPVGVNLFEYMTESSIDESSLDLCLVAMSFLVATDAGIVLARAMHDEIRSQTLASLMMLPRSSVSMVYAKFAGALLGWLPGPMIELAFTLSSRHGRSDFWSLASNEYSSWGFVLLFALVPHFAALLALYARWGAVPLAIGIAIGVLFFVRGMVEALQPGSNSIFFTLVTFAMAFACAGCHLAVLLRIQTLSSR